MEDIASSDSRIIIVLDGRIIIVLDNGIIFGGRNNFKFNLNFQRVFLVQVNLPKFS